jgi:hypothetical protein
MKYVYEFLNYFFGLIFALLGLSFLGESALAGAGCILISALLLPPVRVRAFKLTKISISTKHRAVGLAISFVIFLVGINSITTQKLQNYRASETAERDRSEKLEEARTAVLADFGQNRDEIFLQINKALEADNFGEAQLLTAKYLVTQDPEIVRLDKAARLGIVRVEKEAKILEIETKLKEVPASDLQQNRKLYSDLLRLDPDSALYKSKLDLYSKKLKESTPREIKIPRSMAGDAGSYFLLESTRRGDIVYALHKRVGRDFTGYTRTETNCSTMLMREIGYSETSPHNIKSNPTKWFELVPGSSKSDLANFVCRR